MRSSFLKGFVPICLLAAAAGALAAASSRLTVSATLPAGPQPVSIATGDFNGDGRLDIATGNDGGVSILLGNGDGTFQAAKNVAAPTNNFAIASAAFRDGGPSDLISISNAASGTNNAMILLGNGDAGVVAQAPFSLPGGSASAVVTGDFNGDGKQDFASVSLANGAIPVIGVALGNGNGTFGTPTLFAFTATGTASLATGNLHGASKADLAVTSSGATSVTLFLGDGQGNFTPGADVTVGNGPSGIAAADFNGDGKGDLAVANGGDGTVSVLLGNGTGAFTARTFAAGSSPAGVAVGDFDGDGKLDIAVVNAGGTTVSVLLGKGDGTFAAPVAVKVGNGPSALVAGAFQAGAADLAVANNIDGSVSVLLGPAAPATFTVAQSAGPQTVAAGQPATYTIATAPVAGATGTVSFSASGLPTGAAASFNPASVAKGASSTLTITTTARATALRSLPGAGLPFSFAFVALLGLAGLRKKLRGLAVLGLLAAGIGHAACGGTSAAPSSTGTPAGTYAITVTALSGAESHDLTVTLIVQ
jgi:FG-GAP-like repeat